MFLDPQDKGLQRHLKLTFGACGALVLFYLLHAYSKKKTLAGVVRDPSGLAGTLSSDQTLDVVGRAIGLDEGKQQIFKAAVRGMRRGIDRHKGQV